MLVKYGDFLCKEINNYNGFWYSSINVNEYNYSISRIALNTVFMEKILFIFIKGLGVISKMFYGISIGL